MSRRGTIRHRVTYAMLVALTVAWALVTFWALRPYDSITFTPFVTDAQEYAPGDVITLTNQFCWDGTPFVTTSLLVRPVSEREISTVRFPNGYALPEVAAQYADGCSDSMVKVQIPVAQPPGTYRVRYEVRYKPAFNPLRVVEIANESNEFEIVPQARKAQ